MSRHDRKSDSEAISQDGIMVSRQATEILKGTEKPLRDGDEVLSSPVSGRQIHPTMLLEVSKISKSFGGLQTLQDVSFSVDDGEILGLIGPNGAGKTTVFNLITGVYRLDEGIIRFRGDDIAALKPHQVCRRGIARTFQLVRVCPTMTAFENILVGAVYGRRGQKKHAREVAFECLELLNLVEVKDILSAQLTYSDRRLIEIARAIAARPGLVLLDEPLAGLNPAESEKVMGIIQEIRKTRGISIVWIEHKMDAVFNVCDQIVVLDYGQKIAEGTPNEIANDRKVIEAYLGEPIT